MGQCIQVNIKRLGLGLGNNAGFRIQTPFCLLHSKPSMTSGLYICTHTLCHFVQSNKTKSKTKLDSSQLILFQTYPLVFQHKLVLSILDKMVLQIEMKRLSITKIKQNRIDSGRNISFSKKINQFFYIDLSLVKISFDV